MLDKAADLARATAASVGSARRSRPGCCAALSTCTPRHRSKVELNGKANTIRAATASMPLGGGRQTEIRNNGHEPVYVSLATTGIPRQPGTGRGQRLHHRSAATSRWTARRSNLARPAPERRDRDRGGGHDGRSAGAQGAGRRPAAGRLEPDTVAHRGRPGRRQQVRLAEGPDRADLHGDPGRPLRRRADAGRRRTRSTSWPM